MRFRYRLTEEPGLYLSGWLPIRRPHRPSTADAVPAWLILSRTFVGYGFHGRIVL